MASRRDPLMIDNDGDENHSSDEEVGISFQDEPSTEAPETRARRQSRWSVSQLEGLDPNPRLRSSVIRRESFLMQFAKSKGPPQIAITMVLIAIGLGCVIGVVPAVMSDRFSILNHGYDPTAPSCSSFSVTDKPAACFEGSADAQSAAATSNLISNGLTFVTSSMIGSMSDEYGRKVVAGGFLTTVFVVPETLPPAVAVRAEEKRFEREARLREEEALARERGTSEISLWNRRAWNFLYRPIREMSILNRDSFFRLISLLAFFSGMVSSGDQVLLVYYLEERLNFTAQDVSLVFLVIGLMGLLSQGVLLKPFNDLVGEKMVVALCFLMGAIDNTMYGLARNKETIYIAVALSGFTGMAFPTISAIKANNVDSTEQGRIQGALYSLQALASGVGPVVLRFVYSQAKDTALGPGAMFVFAGVLYLGAVATACALPKDRANSRPSDGASSDSYDADYETGFEPLNSDSEESASSTYGSIE